MLESSAWIKVPGTFNVKVYPIIRKPSVTCANSFIFKTSDCIIILDPGADPEQIRHIKRVILPLKKETDIPVYIFITHCHIDHILSVSMLMEEDINGRIVCHNICAEAIEKRDDNLTLANMNGSILPTCSVSARFFISDNPQNDGNNSNGEYGESFPFRLVSVKSPGGGCLPAISLAISQDDVLDLFHTPGHSPDTICYGLGRFLFTGDIHLATSSGIAGKAGWDNRALAVSLGGIIKAGRERNANMVIPGHGNAIPFEKAEGIFEKVRKEAEGLNDLARLDRARSLYLSDYSLALLEEAGNIFSIISGRLLKVSYYLEMLEENEAAIEIIRSFDSASIEKMVDEFHYFKMELEKMEGAPVISKAVQFVRKVNKLISPDAISHLVEGSLLRRMNSILTDFINVIHGIKFKYQDTLFDVNDAVKGLVRTLKEKPYEEEAIFDAAYDRDKYIQELTRRIAYKPLFSSVIFDFKASCEKILISTDRDTFLDLITAALEPLAAGGEKYISLELEASKDKVSLYLSTKSSKGAALIRPSKMNYIRHSIRVCGGDFNKRIRNGLDVHVFEFPLVGV
ncbi:MAG TPA: MBL fold metallo-hydrolase [Desulfobacteraceae bacterium]|nr:MBL fold metallo-hydrolase [Desulfobacteraceae bacterium]HPJ66869.1 MBL fold metallo-hydrolase [Desulfobacteraceae bacterium]HPQ28435.1 MBL fold metallo-hydrolase [Desulfobacteraceae bacterium]